MKKVKKQRLFRQMIGLFSLLFVTPFGSASDGWVKFTVEIKEGGICKVRGGDVNREIDLGIALAGDLQNMGQTAKETSFDISVEECGDLLNEPNKVKFVMISTRGNQTQLTQGILPNMLLTSANKDTVGVQLLKSDGHPVPIKWFALPAAPEGLETKSNGDTLGAVATQAHAFKLPLKARFYSLTNGLSNKAGAVQAEFIFSAYYE
ncbi:fimbrial protein [Haemophilus sp. C1]|uniref:fimbrial protein n=1 Tax=Haemophilus sp. C1 TaxID=1661745 RepID=UPI000A9B9504|nr:fimbrial protein [Haemophilus sp. C1]